MLETVNVTPKTIPHNPDGQDAATSTPALAQIERVVLALCAGLMLASLAARDPQAQLGALCGVTLSMLNAHALTRLGRFAVSRAHGKPKTVLGLVLGAFQVKLLLLGICLYLMLRFLPISAGWLVAGLSALPVAALVYAVRRAIRETGAPLVPASQTAEQADSPAILAAPQRPVGDDKRD